MTDQQTIPASPVKEDYGERLSKMKPKQFLGELKKIAKRPGGPQALTGGITAIIGAVLLGSRRNGNDPYFFSKKRRKGQKAGSNE